MYNVEDIKARNNIVEYIDRYVPLKKAGRNYQACCPFHNEKSPSFTVAPDKQFYHCFGCGAHGSVIDFVMEYQGVDFKEACEILGGEKDLTRDIDHSFKKSIPIFREPVDHKQDYDKTKSFFDGLEKQNGYHIKNNKRYKPLVNGNFIKVNAMREDGVFLAGGMSYGAGLIYGSGDLTTWLCLTVKEAKEITSSKTARAIVVFNELNLRICAIDCKTQPLFKGAMVSLNGVDNECLIDDLKHHKIICA